MRKSSVIPVFFSFFIFGYIKSNEFNSFENVKNSYIIRAISSDISIDRFYSNKDELKIVNELIELSAPEKKMPIIFLWPEGIIPESYLKDIGTYKNLFLDNERLLSARSGHADRSLFDQDRSIK